MSVTALAPSLPDTDEAPRPRLRLVPPPFEAQDPPAAREVRVLIAAGHALMRAGYRALLEGATGIAVTAEASTADEAISLAHWSEADVVLLESGLPGRESVDAVRELSRLPGASVIVLTSGEEGESPFASLRAGAAGFLLTDCAPHELVEAVHAVAGGDAALSPSIARTLIARFAAQPDLRIARDGLEELTAREREVMALVTSGLMNKQAAGQLGLSEITVKIHRGQAMRKMKAKSLADLVRMAETLGLHQPKAHAS
jgi:DNA-binding NarL/FixJ family response regulator